MSDKNQPLLRRDKGGTAIQAFGPFHADTQTASIVGASAVTLTIPADTKFYELAAIFPCYVDADGAADSSSALFPAGVATYKVLDGQTEVSMMRVIGTDTGPVTLTPVG